MRRPLKVLFVSPYLPSPPQFGGARRLHGLMTGLAERHEVSCCAFINPGTGDHAESIRSTREYCDEVVTVPSYLIGVEGRRKRALQLRSLFSLRSFEWATYVDPEFAARLRDLLASRTFDVITFELAQMAPYRRAVAGLARQAVFVLDEQNIEYEILRRTAASESGAIRRVYNGVNWRKLRWEEIEAWRTFHGSSVTSDQDRDLLLHDLPQARVAVVPNAVDLEYFKARSDSAPIEPLTILFFGSMNYFPNADALKFFLTEIFPSVKARVAGARLRVVGHTPQRLMALANDSVEMKGLVPDVRDEIARAAVVIAPLRIGGGTRLKILEAMSMGKPVVSTPEGAEGLEVAHDRELLVGETASSFADQLVRLLGDPGLAERLSAGARRLVEQRYGWAASVERLENFYLELGAGTATP